MKFPSWLLLTAFAAICSAAVTTKQVNEQQDEASLMSSAVASTQAPQVQITPTTEPTVKEDAIAEALPIQLPATAEQPLAADKNGDIDDDDSSEDIEPRYYVCKYRRFVVYSESPCKGAPTAKQARQSKEIPAVTTTPTPAAQPENTPLENGEEQQKETNLNRPQTNAQKQPKKPTIQPAQKPSGKPTQNRPTKPGQNRPTKPSQNRPIKPGQNGPSKPAQNRPISSGKKPGQNRPGRPAQNRPKKPTQQNRPIHIIISRPRQNRPFSDNEIESRQAQAIKRRRWQEEEYDDDDESYLQNDYYRRYPAQRFIEEYDYY